MSTLRHPVDLRVRAVVARGLLLPAERRHRFRRVTANVKRVLAALFVLVLTGALTGAAVGLGLAKVIELVLGLTQP